MKCYIFLLFLFIVGCGHLPSDNKFLYRYKDKVIVLNGFYKNQKGTIKSEHGFYYYVELEDGKTIIAHNEYLKKVEE